MLMNEYAMVERLVADAEAQKEALLAGLMGTPAAIAPKYFYDPLGCALYGAICELPEYYPTRTERAIFSEFRTAIGAAAGRGKQLVDLGAGDCCKAQAWLPFLAPSRYLAVDLAGQEIATSLARMAPDFPNIRMLGIITDFSHRLDLQKDLEPDAVTFFYPGSSIGNFAPDEASRLLRDIRGHCAGRPGSGLLIGVDTKKDISRLVAAYDDAIGVTAAFNRNVLQHVNRILGSDFRPEGFAHRGLYNSEAGRVEMHLEAIAPQTVHLGAHVRTFAPGERIHTENSYKYTPAEFTQMLRGAGFRDVQLWQDPRTDFAVFYAA
jgi:dimethylhistidine N-methyltransferase